MPRPSTDGALDALDEPLAILDNAACILYANAAWRETRQPTPLFGPACQPGMSYRDVCVGAEPAIGESSELMLAALDSLLGGRRPDFVLDYVDGDGPSKRWYQARLKRFGPHRAPKIMISHHDITTSKLAETDLQHRAMHDALTNLPNRVLFLDRVSNALTSARREARVLAVMMMDLDRFKDVNDKLGHHAGDMVLEEIGRRLNGVLRETDTLARMGGDEFAILLTGLAQARNVQAVADKLLKVFEQPLTIEGQSLSVGSSIGSALFPDHGQDPEALLRQADAAMYRAKHQGGGHVMYGNENNEEPRLERGKLITGLRQALEQNELSLRYEPRVSLGARELLGAEVLLEWVSTEHGRLKAEDFVPRAERTGLVRPLIHWTLNAALRQCLTWQELGLTTEPPTLTVNISTRVLQDSGLPQSVARLLRTYALPPTCLEIGVEEDGLEEEHVFETLSRLGDLGVGICIKDYESGRSGRMYLERLPVTAVALSHAFVSKLLNDDEDADLVRSTIELVHECGLPVTAVGVDNTELLDRLRTFGCDSFQGKLVAAALAREEFERRFLGDGTEESETKVTIEPMPLDLPVDMPLKNLEDKSSAELLAQINLFNLLDQRDLDELATVTRRRACQAGDVIFRKEDPGYTLYLIVSGAVKISSPSPGRGEIILAILRSGQFFGELSLFDDEPRSADAIAVEPTHLLALSREDLLKVLQRRPSVTVHLFKVLSDRIRRTNETLREITSLSLPGRIAKRLLDLADLLGERRPEGFLVPLFLGPEEISNMIGAPASEVERALETFKFGRLIEDVSEGVMILQEQELQGISLG